MPDYYMDEKAFAYYEGECKRRETAEQIAQAKLASAVARISDRLTKDEAAASEVHAGERLDKLESDSRGLAATAAQASEYLSSLDSRIPRTDDENVAAHIALGIAEANAAAATARISARVTELEMETRSMLHAEAERTAAAAHPERLFMYVPCQRLTDESFDPSGTLSTYPRECMIFRQGDTVIMVDTGAPYSVTLIRNFPA